MYGREYGGKVLNFEASGGLVHAALVMQDKETDSYWSIMRGASISGDLKGTRLEELPIGTKTQWKAWVARHPDTLVLSVDGVEHDETNQYDDYFSSDEGFLGLSSADDRLPTKEPIYSFQYAGKAYAVPHSEIKKGTAFALGERQVFLYRPRGAAMFYSSLAFVASGDGFEKRKGAWRAAASGAKFDAKSGIFEGAEVERLDGFDTFWYNWSLMHPETEILRAGGS